MERTPSPHKRTFWDLTVEEHGTGWSEHGGTTRNTVAVEVYDDDLEEDVTVVVHYGYTAGRTQNLTEEHTQLDGELSEDYSASRSYTNRGRSSRSATSYSYDTDGGQHEVPTIWSTHHDNSSSRTGQREKVTNNWTKSSEAWQWEKAGGGTFWPHSAQNYDTNDADVDNDSASAETYNVYGSTVDTVTCDWDQTEDDTYLDEWWQTYVCSSSEFDTVTLNSDGVEVPTTDWRFEQSQLFMTATLTNVKAAADHEYEYTLIGGIDTNILVESFNPFLPVQYDTSFDLNYGCFDIAREEVRWWVKESIKPLANRSDSISGVLSDIFDSTATDKTFSPDVNYSQQKRTTHKVYCRSWDTSERVETEDGVPITYTDTDYSLDGLAWDLNAAPLTTTVEYLGLPFESKEEDGESWHQITVQSKDWDSVLSSCSFYTTTEAVGGVEWTQTYATHHWSSVETVTGVAKSSSKDSILCRSYRSYIGPWATEEWSFIGFYSTTSSSFFISSTTFARTTWDDYYTSDNICRVTTSSYYEDGYGFNNTATATKSTTSAYTATGTTAVTVTVGETKIKNAIYPLGRSVQEWGDFHSYGPAIKEGARGWVQAHPNGWFGFGGGFESTDKVYSALNTALVGTGPLHSSFSTIAAYGIPAEVAVSHDLVAEGQKVKAWATRDHGCLGKYGGEYVFYGWFETSFDPDLTASTSAQLVVTFTDTQTSNETRGSSLSWEARINLVAADSIDGTWFADLGIAGMVTDGPPVNKLKREVGRAYAANFSESPATVSLDVGAWTQTLWTGRGSADSVSSAFTLTEYDTFSFANHQGAVWSSEQIFVVTGNPDYYADFMLGSFTNDHYL